MPVFCLSLHATYRCGHSGACCTSGWTIPVEAPLQARLDAALSSGHLRLPGGERSAWVDTQGASDEAPAILRSSPAGACACYDGARRRCLLHGTLGHDALPSACQHFPRVCLIDEDAAYLTLSHYCPTAARLLFAPEGPLAIVGAPPDFAPMALEGLDARQVLPPLLRPRMLADRESYRRWERWVVATLGEAGSPEEALARIIEATERVRGWVPRDGPLGQAIDAACATWACDPVRQPTLSAAALALDAVVRRSVPAELRPAALPGAIGRLHHDMVAPRWPSFEGPVRRYLAAKAFANWCSYQGLGLRTVTASLVAALAVVRVEAARQCAEAGQMLDERLLIEAFRSADLLLMHLCSREELARRLSTVETTGTDEMRAALG
jgi:hypothetical protein